MAEISALISPSSFLHFFLFCLFLEHIILGFRDLLVKNRRRGIKKLVNFLYFEELVGGGLHTRLEKPPKIASQDWQPLTLPLTSPCLLSLWLSNLLRPTGLGLSRHTQALSQSIHSLSASPVNVSFPFCLAFCHQRKMRFPRGPPPDPLAPLSEVGTLRGVQVKSMEISGGGWEAGRPAGFLLAHRAVGIQRSRSEEKLLSTALLDVLSLSSPHTPNLACFPNFFPEWCRHWPAGRSGCSASIPESL